MGKENFADETAKQTPETDENENLEYEELEEDYENDEQEDDEETSVDEDYSGMTVEQLVEENKKLKEQKQKAKRRLARGYKKRDKMKQQIIEEAQQEVERRLQEEREMNELLNNYPEAKSRIEEIREKKKALDNKISFEEAYRLVNPNSVAKSRNQMIHGSFQSPRGGSTNNDDNPIYQAMFSKSKNKINKMRKARGDDPI